MRPGSRFAPRWQRGLFHGSRSRFGCLLEGAYDELVFQNGPERPFPRSSAMRKALVQVEANRHDVSLRCLDDNTVHHFPRRQFDVNGAPPS
jgi:hypothetical protein